MPASDELSQLRAQLHSETGATFPRADDAHFDELHGLEFAEKVREHLGSIAASVANAGDKP